ncbi:hypothetical protein [Microbacterium sp.]|uniref:hypothetical protein n=1 Tax=Microbacterium sp. TaxID=51671 RepID=UPI003C765C5B
MTDTAAARPNPVRFWIGWGLLLFLIAGLTLNHVVGLFRYRGALVERLTFPVFIALGLYALAVLIWPYRSCARWAWAVTWVFVAVTAVSFLFLEPAIGWFYVGGAAAMALGQLLTLPHFLRAGGVNVG